MGSMMNGVFARGVLLSSLLLLCMVAPSAQDIVGNLQVRLVDGPSNSEGRVEVRRFDNETWSTVCGNMWNGPDAAVVCRQLDPSFAWGQPSVNYYSEYGTGTGQIYLSNTQCRGNETNLGQCQTSAWGEPYYFCPHSRDAAVSCYQKKVRLQPQTGGFVGAVYGAVEVLRETDYSWVSLCDSGWDDNDAAVVCRSLGYDNGKKQCCGKLTRGTSYTTTGSARSINCSGSESSFGSCSYTYSQFRCPSSPGLASVICYNGNMDTSFDIRLTNGSSYYGRVEVKHLGVWGAVCSDQSWNDTAASVTCRQLTGRGGGVRLGRSSSSGYQGSGWVTQLNCTGDENSLEQCVVPPWGAAKSSCYPQYTLCYSNTAPVVRLVAGSNSHGRVEITMDGTTYTVCDDYWSTNDATVVCKNMGYAGGQAVKGSHYGQGSGQVAMNGVLCAGNENSLLACRSNGWLQSTAQCDTHNKDASVYCHGPVKLTGGDHSNGILQVSVGGYYRTVCGTGFGDVDAAVACRDLGFENGRKLPAGSYGSYYSTYTWNNLTCLGGEMSVYNCSHSNEYCYTDSYRNYAAVHCYNGTLDTTSTLTLTGGMGDYANSSGHLRLYQNGVRGRICTLYWDDKDAKVACRQLGYSGGLAYALSNPIVGPYLWSEINCVGTENTVFDCPRGNASCQSSSVYVGTGSSDAGVFCFNNEAPQIQLVGGNSDREGRVEIIFGESSGTVCYYQYYYYRYRAASVVCKSLGYATGDYLSVTGGEGPVALSGVFCSGYEGSLFSCRNNGFMAQPPDSCNSHTYDLGVVCYDEVRLYRQTTQDNNTVVGVVQLYKNDAWNFVCGTFFDDADAAVVCRKLGYGYSRALPAGAFGSAYYYRNVVGGVNCTGTEGSLGQCPMQDGSCQNTNYQNYGSVVCSKIPIPQGIRAVEPTSQPGVAVMQVDGLQSRVCSRQWDNNDAAVYCRSLGYGFGRAFGTTYATSSLPLLVSNITCRGDEASITACPFTTGTATSCGTYETARVFCYNREQDFQVRLVGGQVVYKGNVEINLNGQWSSVCDWQSSWTSNDAGVVCRSLGYVGGEPETSGSFGSAASPTGIIGPSCQGNEDSITSCRLAAFNNSVYASLYQCSSRPAAVRCTGEVKLTPNETYGAVQMLVNANTSAFGLVCSDDFGAEEATVVCRELGFPFGLHMCCSAFGNIYSPSILRTNLQCTGREVRLRDCPYSDSMNYCPSRKYASVVCSTQSPSTGYAVSVETTGGSLYGRVKVQHMGYWGYVCPDGFDDNDANVICREAGYAGGISYEYNNYRYGTYSDIRWLSNLNCAGTESFLTRCRNVVWGNVTQCSRYADAAVFCYQNSAPQLRLVNGTSSTGRLELWSDNFRGTVCARYWDDREATAACKGLGFNGGRFLGSNTYGQGTGDVLVEYTYCSGSEASLFDCYLRLKGAPGYSYCNSHRYDAAVQCFNTTRFAGSSLAYYGRAEVVNNGSWVAVCDQGFEANAARVVCRAMGYSYARAQCCSAVGPLPSSSSIAATTIGAVVRQCSGSESSLLDCDISLTDTCSSGTYASVLCSNEAIEETPLQTRLRETVYGTSRTYLGGVQVNRYGFWGPVCNSSWDDRDANATCHGLGYSYGITFYGRDLTGLPMVVGNFECTGQESSLADCTFGDIDVDLNCSLPIYNYQRQDAGALCFNTPGVGIRLVDGGHNYGRVEIQFQGEWGRVTDYSWSNQDATIACKQLGYKGGKIPPSSMRINHPDPRAKIWMAYVRCYGHERTLFECYSYWDYLTFYRTDANVICYNDVRLSRGNQVSAGVVEVNINNKWGSICDNQWNDRNTELTCQNLGYDNGFHLCCGAYGMTFYPLMESVSCSASDTDITRCSHDIPGTYVCTSSAVSVACYKGSTPTYYTYSLDSGPTNNTGDIKVEFMNITGRTCSDGWDDNDAKVFCKELGFQFGAAYEHFLYTGYYLYYAYNGPYWMTDVNCQGTESSLRDCQKTVGRVSQCRSGKAAGVLCTNTEGIFYRLGGSDSGFQGRVEVSVDGVWGTVCRSYFSSYDAAPFCRSLGFNEGRADYSSNSYPDPPSKIYQAAFSCQGDENSLEDCPHQGWKVATSSYCTHRIDAKVICYNDVRIGGAYNPTIKQGPVQFYKNGTWYNLCDTGFSDLEARRVCQDLEFLDGKAVCCSAYGSTSYYVRYYPTHLNFSMQCQGNEQSSGQCIRQDNNCDSGNYASVVCFDRNDYVDESTYSFDFVDSTKTSGPVAVTHLNITGRVCNNDWDDNDARVMCRTKGHLDGLAFHYSQYNYASFTSRGPFWVSGFNCTGNETRLQDCPFNDRLHLGNCSKADLAGAVCFNESGIQYRISSDVPQANEGRVEISVGGVWGTVCNYYWDDRDAKVFCRNQGYNDGYSISNTFGVMGSGPMWLSNLRCAGTESNLHQCPHSGFSDEPVEDGYYYYGCGTHQRDAYVSCVDQVKLNLGYKASMGAVMVYRQNAWTLICDSGLSHADAQVLCRQFGFQSGTFLQGSVFGPVDAKIGITNVRCRGTEADFSTCDYDVSSACRSQQYASVYCSNDPIQEERQNVRVVRDDSGEDRHGYLEYQVDGVWGAVCAATMDINSVTVACRQLGFTGGRLYRPSITTYKQPILTSDLKCKGTESQLDDCPRAAVPSAWCDYTAPRAGILCYNDTEGISYQLTGDTVPSRGRFEMKYMGQWGFVCTFYDNNPAAQVACKSLGYGGGLAVQGTRYAPTANEPVWFFALTCRGNESSIPECRSTGFNTTGRFNYYYERYCRGSYGPFSAQCYQDKLVFTEVRLVDGDNNSSGRVEVFLQGPNQWGTVCDDYWNDVDATVVCNQLGFATGKAVMQAGFGQGSGNIWMDNVGCTGSETRLQDCGFNGYNVHNCLHSEDAGVRCYGVYVPPTTTTTTTTTMKPTQTGKTTPTPSTTRKTDKPPVTQKQTGSDSNGTNTAAIVAPIAVILVIAVAAVVGFLLYRRRKDPASLHTLTEDGTTRTGSLTFDRGGVVRFMNKMRGQGSGEEGGEDIRGVSNPGYDNRAASSPDYDNASADVVAQDHADFSSNA